MSAALIASSRMAYTFSRFRARSTFVPPVEFSMSTARIVR